MLVAEFVRLGRFPEGAVTSVIETWINPWSYRFVRCYIKKLPHFRHTSTSIAESSHAGLKRWVTSSTGDLATVFKAIQRLETQESKVSTSRAQRMNTLQFDTDTDLFSLVRVDVVPLALDAITRELRLIPQPQRGAPPRAARGPLWPFAVLNAGNNGPPVPAYPV